MMHKPVDRNTNAEKYEEIIQEIIKNAQKKGLSDLDFIDQIPDNEIQDEPIPFPYGGGSSDADVWKS